MHAAESSVDERGGYPSASGVEGYSLCLGKFNAEKVSPFEGETFDAATGKRIHTALETGNYNGLTDDEIETVQRCAKLRDDIASDFSTAVGDGPLVPHFEERSWMFDGATTLMSGKPDVVFIKGYAGLIVDYKTGRLGAELAPGNKQLRALAVMIADQYKLNFVRVAIVQPWVSPQVSVCDYEMDDLVNARKEIRGILSKIIDSNAPRLPGDHQCKYCRAKATCPEANGVLSAVSAVRVESWEMLKPERKVALYDACKVADNVIKQIRDRLKADLEGDADCIPGLALKQGVTRRSITDAPAAFAQLSGAIDAQAFAGCCSVKIGDLEKAFKAATGLGTRESKEQFEILLEDVIETKQAAPSLERTKE